MTVGLVDTTVIVHLFRANPLALAWFEALPRRLASTPITWMEIIDGASGKAGQAKCKAILNEFDMEYPTRTDMDWAMQQLERYRLSHGIGMNDCLIASVAYRLQVPLYTHSLKHMRVLVGDSLAIQPYT
jgi:predicted nucleic acid-binding protein